MPPAKKPVARPKRTYSFKAYKRNMAFIRKGCPVLFNFDGKSLDDNELIVCMYVGGKFVAATDFNVEGFSFDKGELYHTIDIQLFEVVEKHQGNGYGRKLFKYILEHYKANVVTLRHRYDDDGESKDFWKMMGFVKDKKSCMDNALIYKKIK